MRDEVDFAAAMTSYLQTALEKLSTVERIKQRLGSARDAISEVGLGPLSVGLKDRKTQSILEDRLATALIRVGELARNQHRGVVFLLDEAHTLYDNEKQHRFPLGALLSAFVAAQDDDDEPNPVMLVLCGLPLLIGNIHAARSNAERFFRGPKIDYLPLEPKSGEELSEAALALAKPAEDEETLSFEPGLAEEIARDVDGYPYFIQWFGEALWDAADLESLSVIDRALYQREADGIRDALDSEFFEPRYRDARPADQRTLRIAGSLGGEQFTKSQIDRAGSSRSTGAIAQSLTRLVEDNLLYRDDHGVYAYTAPVFGEFLRRRHPRLDED